jgi:hypothetical protein
MEFHLDKIRDRHSESVVEQLLKVQKHKYEDEKSSKWVKKLQCLTLSDTSHKRRRLANYNGQWIQESQRVLRRILVRGCERDSPFVAVSCWNDSQREDSFVRYKVESRNGTGLIQSEVSDHNFDRVIADTNFHNMKGFWIDKA